MHLQVQNHANLLMNAWQGRCLLGELYSTGKAVNKNTAQKSITRHACVSTSKSYTLLCSHWAHKRFSTGAFFWTDRLQHHKWKGPVLLCHAQLLSLLCMTMAPMTNQGPIAWA